MSVDRACTGKRKYREGQAYKVAKIMSRKNKVLVTPYHCRYCKWWHVGHATKEARSLIQNGWRPVGVTLTQ